MQDVKEQVEDLRIAISNKAIAANMPQKVVENLQDTILQYEAVEKKAIDEKKQEIYLKSQQIEEIKDIVPLLGLGIIAESLTHEMNRIEQNIEDCARDMELNLKKILNCSEYAKLMKSKRYILYTSI